MTRIAIAWMFVSAIVASGLTAAALLVVMPELTRPIPATPAPQPVAAQTDDNAQPMSQTQTAPDGMPPGDWQGEIDALRAEVSNLRNALAEQADRQPVPDLDGGSLPDSGVAKGELRDALRNLLETENNESVKDAVRRAINEIRREEKEAAAAANAAKNKDALLKLVGNRLDELRDELGLSDDQVGRIGDLAQEFLDERQAAAANGASADELAAMDRAAQRGVQDIMGATNYREFRKAEILRAGRPMVGMALAMAGLDAQQWDNVNRYLEGHVDRIADNDVRLQTEDLSPEQRQELKAETDAANQDAWSTILQEYLTDEQRSRVPKK